MDDAIGLSVMGDAQASAITFLLNAGGRAILAGLDSVQVYFWTAYGVDHHRGDLFCRIYQRLNVYTAYEYLGRKRFDTRGRVSLGAAVLFLLQRAARGGLTIYKRHGDRADHRSLAGR